MFTEYPLFDASHTTSEKPDLEFFEILVLSEHYRKNPYVIFNLPWPINICMRVQRGIIITERTLIFLPSGLFLFLPKWDAQFFHSIAQCVGVHP
jgi:hypothetical protein